MWFGDLQTLGGYQEDEGSTITRGTWKDKPDNNEYDHQ